MDDKEKLVKMKGLVIACVVMMIVLMAALGFNMWEVHTYREITGGEYVPLVQCKEWCFAEINAQMGVSDAFTINISLNGTK